MPDESNSQPVEARVGYAVKRAQQALNNAMTTALEPLDLAPASYALMAALEVEPGLSNADAARRGFVTPQTNHQLLVQLERRQLVERQPHPVHGRIRQMSLTAQGRQVLAAAHKAVLDIEARMLHDLKPEEVANLTHMLHCIAGALTRPGSHDGSAGKQPDATRPL
jgi:DNA-binding MarR family transcriptional regulator